VAAMRLRLRRSSPGSLPLLPADEALPALFLAALAVSVGERRCLRELVASLGSGDSPSLLGKGWWADWEEEEDMTWGVAWCL
jgi:hypothetical protein